jgi:dienelactone hydrolase
VGANRSAWVYRGVLRWACALTVCALAAGAPSSSGSTTIKRTAGFGVHVFRFVDRTRTIRLPSGRRVPRTIETIVRYPNGGSPHPLVVFGHGYTLTPARYARLLRAWTLAGYVVAAPVFPLENANAPGGPNESDLVNQPADMRLVITRLLALNTHPGGVIEGAINAARIAVAGHSDGAETALAVAYDPRYRDRRVRAAIILAGAELPHMGPFPHGSPPLLAVQGTADPINPPGDTYGFFRAAPAPKFLLRLLSASHLPPFTDQEPQLSIVERVTIAFLDRYLGHGSLAALLSAARNPGRTRFTANP